MTFIINTIDKFQQVRISDLSVSVMKFISSALNKSFLRMYKGRILIFGAGVNVIYYDRASNYTAAKNFRAIHQMTKTFKKSFKFLNN
jgi:hypothetical protein